MTSKLLTTYKQQVRDLKLIPASGGAFELSVDGKLLYSKLETGDFPDEQAAVEMRFVQELSMAAIGKQLGRGAEAARLFLFRIRQRLADCVKKRLSMEMS